MKKLLATVMSVLVFAAMSVSVYAKLSDASVWINANAGTMNESKFTVSVETDGEAADGLLTITYDPSIVSCTEDSVVFGEKVKMHSVNAEERGVLKISYLAAGAIPEGELLTVNFELQPETSGKVNMKNAGIGLTGEAHDADGKALNVGMKKGGSNGNGNNGNGNNGNGNNGNGNNGNGNNGNGNKDNGKKGN